MQKNHSYIDFLKSEFAKRTATNPRFSMRAFAKFLSVDSSYLLKIFKGQRKITKDFLLQSSARLGADQTKFSEYKKLYKPDCFKLLKDVEPGDYSELSQEQFKIIADWYHYAILELTTISSFKPSAEWIAANLNITVTQARNAINRLFKLQLLKEEEGAWRLTGQNTTMGNSFTSEAFTSLQKQI